MTNPLFMLSGETIHNLYSHGGVYETAANSLFNPTKPSLVFSTGTNRTTDPRQDSFGGTPVLVYTEFSTFRSDVGGNLIDTGIFEWVGYDLEEGSTPYPDDQLFPVEYLQLFGQLAHASGFRCVALPGKDLGNNATDPAKTGMQTNEDWYEDNYIAMVCAQFFDAVVIQSQSDESTTTGPYVDFVSDAVGKATQGYVQGSNTWPNLGNQSAIVFSELSTSTGSATAMEDCWNAYPTQGLYLNSQNPDYVTLYNFLNSVFTI